MFRLSKIHKKLNETNGAISIYVIIMMVFLLPFALWVGIELPKSHEYNQRVKDAVDSASASGVTLIDTPAIDSDTIVVPLIDKQAKALAIQIFALKMGLETKGDYSNVELVPPEGSLIKEATIKVEVPDADVSDGEEDDFIVTKDKSKTLYVQTANGKKKVENSSVIVTATVTYKKAGFLGNDITVTHVGINQARLKNDY